jgi:hypothetical protein
MNVRARRNDSFVFIQSRATSGTVDTVLGRESPLNEGPTSVIASKTMPESTRVCELSKANA